MNVTQAPTDVTNKYILTTATVLSVLGASIIILTFFIFKDIRTPARHIIVCIAISDLVSSLSNCFGLFQTQDHPEGKNHSCIIQSFIGSTFILSSFLWTVLLAVFLYIVIVCEKPDSGKTLIFPLFHGISWILPLIINIAAILNNKLGNSQRFVTAGWCWIDLEESIKKKSSNRYDVMWMLIDGKAIELLAYVAILILYIIIKIQLKAKICNYFGSSSEFITENSVKIAKLTDRKLIFIPLCFIFCRMWGTIRFFMFVNDQNSFDGQLDVFQKFLLYMHSIGDNSLGAVNCILFCFVTPKVVGRIKSMLLGCYFRTCRSRSNTDFWQIEEDELYSRLMN